MKIVDIELVRAHCNSLPEDEVLLEYYTEVAEEMVVSETRRTDEELIAMGGGSYPTRIKQAVLLIVAHFYKVREAVSTINEILTPFAYAACVKPFRKFATDWKNENNDMYNGIIKGETGLFVNLDISEVNSNRQQSIGLSLNIQDISVASAEANGLVTAYDVQKELKKKQDKLVSGKNIKTVGGESLLGSGDLLINAVADVQVGGVSVVQNGVANFGTAVNAVMINGQQAPNNGGVVNLGEFPFQTDYSGVTIGTVANRVTLDGRDITIGNIVNFPQVAILGTGFNVNTRNVNIGTDTTESVSIKAGTKMELLCNSLTLGTAAVRVQGENFFVPNLYCTNLLFAQKKLRATTMYLGGDGGGPTAEIKLANTLDKIIITCNNKSAEIPLS